MPQRHSRTPARSWSPLPAHRAGSERISARIKRTSVSRQLTITITLPRGRRVNHVPPTKVQKAVQSSQPTAWSVIVTTLLTFMAVFSLVALLMAAIPVQRQVPKKLTVTAVATVSQPLAMKRSAPTRLLVPAAGIDTSLVGVGKTLDGSIDMPNGFDIAGWYELAPTPGEIGPAVIVGHLDSIYGPAVFWNLDKLHPGDTVQVDRSDGNVATFKVNKLALFPQDNFPTQAVYGNINYAGLRLITCGGQFNYLTRHYSHNVVVYASLITQPTKT